MKSLTRLHSFISDCMKEMQAVPNLVFEREVHKFIQLNNEILGKPFPGFRYRGTQYGRYEIGERSPNLHHSLEDSFVVVLMEKQNSIEELVPIKHFLINTVNATVSVEDLYELIPVGLHQFIEGYSSSLLAPPRRFSSKDLEAYKARSQPVINKIGEVLAINMLVV